MPLGLTPYISIGAESGGARKAIAWYKSVFGATIKSALTMSCGDGVEKVGHAELVFGGNVVMLSDAFSGMSKTPAELGGSPVTFALMYPHKSKDVYDAALKEGATVVPSREYKEQPWGWEAGTVVDPFGYTWTIGEDVKKWSDQEISNNMKMTDISDQF
jgi:PhnB protein